SSGSLYVILTLDYLIFVLDRFKTQSLQSYFKDWLKTDSDSLRIKHLSIDGKTLRGSGSAKLGPLHLVSAWASAQHLSLGQVAVDAKSNEITALPTLLELLERNGALVTIDARGGHRMASCSDEVCKASWSVFRAGVA